MVIKIRASHYFSYFYLWVYHEFSCGVIGFSSIVIKGYIEVVQELIPRMIVT
ncbi:MAG: hypothetical protein WCI77_00875 [Candidatus Omnitrophota bacterium]